MSWLKRLSFSTLILATMLVMVSKEVKSQDIQITSIYELNYPLCSVPDTSKIQCNLYNFGPFGAFAELINVHFDFGDGTDSLYSFTLTSLPAGGVYSLEMEHIYTAPGIYTLTIISTCSSGAVDTASHVNIVSAGCGSLIGSTYIDNNSNCIFDTGDDTLRNFPIYLTDASGVFSMATVSDSLGAYTLLTNAGVNYNASVAPGAFNLVNACPISGVYNFTGTSTNIVYDFGMVCLPDFDALILSSSSVPIPGSNMITNFVALNYSCLPVSGTITLNHDSLLTYFSCTGPIPSSVSPGVVTWNYSDLNFETGAPMTNGIVNLITFITDTLAVSGDTMYFTFTITPTTGDINTTNNVFTYYKIVNAPYDPNIKTVFPIGAGPLGNVDPETNFTYTVFFQNTGTAPAIDVKIKDTLDTDLDLMTFQLIGSSHYMMASISSDNVLTAMFDNINLPDSTTDEPGSHGWFTYKVKAKAGLPSGTSIENTAHIFFDYNPAIVTNTTLNTIDLAVSVDGMEITPNTLCVYPNPANNNVYVKTQNMQGKKITITDLSGRVVLTQTITGELTVLNTQQLVEGLYLISEQGNVSTTIKLIVSR